MANVSLARAYLFRRRPLLDIPAQSHVNNDP
jgi:hypothetical protein